MDFADRVRQIQILSHLTDPQIEALCGCLSRVSYDADSGILKEGEPPDQSAYFIDSGKVLVRRDTPYGHFSLAELGSGELFGETSFVDQNQRSSDVTTAEETVILKSGSESLSQLCEADAKFKLALYWAFWKSLSAKLRKTNERLAHFFSTTGEHLPSQAREEVAPAEFHVGMQAKRELFLEQRLSPMEINFLSSLSKEKRYEGGKVIFREGELGDRMYIVLDGQVMISKLIRGAGEEALAILERGDYFGEMALIDHQPRSADAKAHSEGAVVLEISREVLEGILDIHKVSSFRLLRLLCNLIAKRLREIDDKLIGWYIFASGSGQSLEVPSL